MIRPAGHRVSILIPSFNGKHLLRENLSSVIAAAKNYREVYEIIIIDDGSTDGTKDFIESNFPEVKTIRRENTSGYGGACNYGAGYGDGEILIFLNNDVKVEADFIEPLVKDLEGETVFAVGARSIMVKKGYINEAVSQGYFKKGVLVFEYPGKKRNPDFFDTTRPILHICGAAFACRKDKFSKLGGFDPIFKPFYWEDVDLSYRAWKRGWYSLYEPKSIVYHEHSSTVNNFYSEDYIKFISRRNRLLFYWKNITDSELMLKHVLWLPWWLGENLWNEDIGWIKSLAAALSRRGDIKLRRRQEKFERKWSDARVINLAKGKNNDIF